MIVFTKASAIESFVVTLNEKKTLTDPYYLFVFEHVTTKEKINTIINSVDDLSNYPDRFNEFNIATSTLFATSTVGQWNYFIYEQLSPSNLITTGLNLVEMGKMVLLETNTIFTGYDTTTTFKGYGG